MHYQFISVIESDIFETVDSTYGEAHIAKNGQYNISIGDETYVYDLKHYFTFVASNNQLIIEKSDGSSNDDILFITKLDEFYKSYILHPDSVYRLVKKEKVIGDFPDSLIVKADKKNQEIQEISYNSKQQLRVHYKNKQLKKVYIPDLFVFNAIMVELKSCKEITPEHIAQLFNYMRITNTKVGYILNFGNIKELEWQRFII